MLMMVLDSVGLKIETGTPLATAYGMIFGIDALLDMGQTVANVTGDLTVTGIIAKSESNNPLLVKSWTAEKSMSCLLDQGPIDRMA